MFSREDFAANFRRRCTLMAQKLREQFSEDKSILSGEDEEAPYCQICYTNQLRKDRPDAVLSLECAHSFCSECSLQQLRLLIERADVEKVKCFDFECGAFISGPALQRILEQHDQGDLWQKYERFRD